MAVAFSLLLCGCADNSQKDEKNGSEPAAQESPLEQYRTDYVGDNSSVANIAGLTEYPEGYAYDHIAIQSDEEPYGLTVYLKAEEGTAAEAVDFEGCAETAFGLIGNLSLIDYVNADTDETIASFERSEQ